MDRPLDIAFHNLQRSASVETEIRKHVARLEQRCESLVGCRVSVEALHRQHQTGNLYEVHVTLSMPGRDLVVSREPHHAKERHAHPDVHTAVRDAFRAAEKQLDNFKRRQRGPQQAAAGGAVLAGEVALLEPGADHGFLTDSNGTRLYFHRDSVTNCRFETLQLGDLVHYASEDGDVGPVAVKVRLAQPATL